MRKRPLSITIIAWYLIIASIISLISITLDPVESQFLAQMLIPIYLIYILMYSIVIISIICGIGFLLAQNWARWLYIIWGSLNLILNLIISHAKLLIIPGAIIFIVIIVFLLLPKTNQYFKK